MASPRPKPKPVPPLLVAVLVALGVLVGARAVQLAILQEPPRLSRAQAPAQPAEPLASPAPPSLPTQPKLSDARQELRAMIAAACPHALELFDAEGGVEPRRLPPVEDEAESCAGTDLSPSLGQEGMSDLRVAMRPSPHAAGLRVAQRDKTWLVPPDNWFSPEDLSKGEGGAGMGEAAATDTQPFESPDREPALVLPPAAVEQEVLAPRGGELAEPEEGFTPEPLELPAEIPGPFFPAPPMQSPSIPTLPEQTPRTPTESTYPELAPSERDSQPADPQVEEPSGPDLDLPPELPTPTLKPTPEPATPAKPPKTPRVEPAPPLPYPTTDPTLPKAEEPIEPASPSESPAPPAEKLPAPPITPQAPRVFAPPAAPQPRTAPHPPATIAPRAGVPSPHSPVASAADPAGESKLSSIQAHQDLFAKNCFPSARECGACHKKHYDEWRVSGHAYAFVSPMFQKFEQRLSDLSQGTVGYFCYRCHSPVATTMALDRTTPMWEMPQVAQEGITCVACHRINERYTKSNGERRIVPGDIHAPVYGGIGGDGVAEAIARKDHYKVKTSPQEKGAGQAIHVEGRYFDHLGQAEFCTSCHQVAVHPGIKLEVVWEQYRQSPACKKGVTCQDCHMGLRPGEASGYETCSIAEVGGKSVNDKRKHANHIFYGPNYSISHPAVFPDNKDADRWKMHEWLRFNWRAGWGTDEFEDAVEDGTLRVAFPKEWANVDDRCDAREIIEDNQKAMERKQVVREEIMSHSLRIEGPFFRHTPSVGRDVRLYYDVTNMNEGHNVLTASLGAQPQLWANVVLVGPDGQRLWETGYTDSDGDVCDIHSRDVRTRRLPFDYQLFNLQTMFLITGATGTDREMPLPVNVDIDQLPFLRPGAIPITTTNHPPFIRMESRSIAPLGTKRVSYKIPGELLTRPGKYRLSFRMRNRIEPIWFMRFCNATDEMVRMMNEGILDIHPRSVEFWVK